jgi:hypothetical protein
MIEQDRSEVIAKSRLNEAPHVLVTAETVGEHDGSVTGSVDLDMVALEYRHCAFVAGLADLGNRGLRVFSMRLGTPPPSVGVSS